MKTIRSTCARKLILSLLPLLLVAAAYGQALPHLFEPGSGTPNKLLWRTEPGYRYDLWKSDNLTNWSHVTGYPAVAAGLAMEYAFTPGPKGFFKILPVDDQPPVVVAQYPLVSGFAVGRFADVTVDLEDASGIDPASIRLSVGLAGPLAQGAPGLTVTGGTITYDSGDAALGAWGETLTATLVAADTLGHSLTHTWTFRLEPEPLVAANVFVFGSPTAQRSGQEVGGPAAALASRFPAPAGPQKANDPPTWSIESVEADRIVIAYATGGAPGFTAGQLICNLAPATVREIFYRRVLSIADDVGNLRLTVYTEDADLVDFITQGAASLSEESVAYELDGDGKLVRALSVSGTLTLDPIGFDASGASVQLRQDGGYAATLPGLGTFSSGSGATYFNATLSEWVWSFTPRIRAALEIDASGMKAFEAIATGQLSIATAFNAEVVIPWDGPERTIYTSHENGVPKDMRLMRVVRLPGPVPVFVTVALLFDLKAKASASVGLQASAHLRNEIAASFGATYDRATGLQWVRSFQATPTNFGGKADLAGTFSYTFTIDPRVEMLVYGLAGEKTGLEGSVGVKAVANPTGTPPYKGYVNASVDAVFGTAGPAYAALGLDTQQVSRNIWSGQFALNPDELAFTTHPQSQTVAPDADFALNCEVESPSPPEFQWYQNGTPIPGQTSRSLFIPSAKSGHAGSYFVRVKASGLSRDSNVATLTVQRPIPPGFAFIPAGSFQMGDQSNPLVGDGDELPVNTVSVSAFYMAKYETTKDLWDTVRAWGLNNGYTDLPVGNGSSISKGTNHPVHSINWYAMVKWCNARSQKEGFTPCYTVSGVTYKTGSSAPDCNWSASGYRLPSEAEWEKAARGGVSGKNFPWGTDTISHSQANFWNSGGEIYQSGTTGPHPVWSNSNDGVDPYSSPVGSFAPNGYGLYDMAGNMWEWCWDWYASYPSTSQSDPRGPASGSYRVGRGGSWDRYANHCRVANRFYFTSPTYSSPYVGFRVARSSVP